MSYDCVKSSVLSWSPRWLSLLWNHSIAPAVSQAVIAGSGSDSVAGGQQKVANTALYVLMQRAVVSGCPLTGQGE